MPRPPYSGAPDSGPDPTGSVLKEHRLQPAPGHTWRSLAAGLTDAFALATLDLLDSGELEAWKGTDGVVRYYPRHPSPAHLGVPCNARLAAGAVPRGRA